MPKGKDASSFTIIMSRPT